MPSSLLYPIPPFPPSTVCSQGHRAYFGFRKTIMPEKRRVVQILLNRTLLHDPQQSVDDLIVAAHTNIGQPQIRKANRDSVYYPLPECMCLRKQTASTSS